MESNTTGPVMEPPRPQGTQKAPEPEKGPTAPPSPRPPRGPANSTLIALVVTFVGALVLGTAAGGKMWAGVKDTWQGLWGHGPVSTTQAATDHGYVYVSPMDPTFVSTHPGVDSMGMPLVRKSIASFTGEIALDPVVVQNIGVRIAPVIAGPLIKTIRTVGSVDYDETRLYDVNLKTGGWIEKLHVNYLGAPVNKGEPLFDLYSPELYAAQEE